MTLFLTYIKIVLYSLVASLIIVMVGSIIYAYILEFLNYDYENFITNLRLKIAYWIVFYTITVIKLERVDLRNDRI